MNHAERIDYLKKLFDSKMSKAKKNNMSRWSSVFNIDVQGGSVNRSEHYGISNEDGWLKKGGPVETEICLGSMSGVRHVLWIADFAARSYKV